MPAQRCASSQEYYRRASAPWPFFRQTKVFVSCCHSCCKQQQAVFIRCDHGADAAPTKKPGWAGPLVLLVESNLERALPIVQAVPAMVIADASTSLDRSGHRNRSPHRQQRSWDRSLESSISRRFYVAFADEITAKCPSKYRSEQSCWRRPNSSERRCRPGRRPSP